VSTEISGKEEKGERKQKKEQSISSTNKVSVSNAHAAMYGFASTPNS